MGWNKAARNFVFALHLNWTMIWDAAAARVVHQYFLAKISLYFPLNKSYFCLRIRVGSMHCIWPLPTSARLALLVCTTDVRSAGGLGDLLVSSALALFWWCCICWLQSHHNSQFLSISFSFRAALRCIASRFLLTFWGSFNFSHCNAMGREICSSLLALWDRPAWPHCCWFDWFDFSLHKHCLGAGEEFDVWVLIFFIKNQMMMVMMAMVKIHDVAEG